MKFRPKYLSTLWPCCVGWVVGQELWHKSAGVWAFSGTWAMVVFWATINVELWREWKHGRHDGDTMKTILVSDFYNALYEDGVRTHQGKPEYLDGETLLSIFPDAECYGLSNELYDEFVAGYGYPDALEDFRLERCVKYR